MTTISPPTAATWSRNDSRAGRAAGHPRIVANIIDRGGRAVAIIKSPAVPCWLGWLGVPQSAGSVTMTAEPSVDALVGLDAGPVRERPSGVGVYVRELAVALAAEAEARVVRLGI